VKSFTFDRLDAGRLTVNRAFVPLLQQQRLDTFEALFKFRGGSVAKNLLRERTTTRVELHDASGSLTTLFLKRHARIPLKEYVKPLLRLTRPIIGARPEWDAILRFHELGIATMLPVALGESSGCSLLMTEGIEGCRKVPEWLASRSKNLGDEDATALQTAIESVADIARTLHGSGMHHQDFYLTHFMVPLAGPPCPVHVLDLGRVREHRRLAGRWIVKDLGQLNFSARDIAKSDRLRFLTHYLGRPLAAADRPLIRRILRKSRAIARHSNRHGL
jgi:heptose I phosphotransferase